MSNKALIQEFLEKLKTIDSFNREKMLIGHDNRGGSAEICLWHAMELSAQEGRRWILSTRGGSNYEIATAEKRVKRVRSRRRAASRILDRQVAEIRRIDLTALSQKDQNTVRHIEEQLASLTVRNRVLIRDSQKKKPKGL